MLPFSGVLLRCQHHGVHLFVYVFQQVDALISRHKDCVLPLFNPVLLSSFVSSVLARFEGSIVSLNTIISPIDIFNGPENDYFLKLFLVQFFHNWLQKLRLQELEGIPFQKS